jgi:hypothetical protein
MAWAQPKHPAGVASDDATSDEHDVLWRQEAAGHS